MPAQKSAAPLRPRALTGEKGLGVEGADPFLQSFLGLLKYGRRRELEDLQAIASELRHRN